MTHPASALAAARRTRPTLLAAVAGTALLGVLGFPSVAGWPSSPASSVSSADGVIVPDGVTVYDDEYPAVTKLDPALLAALRRAAADAASDGVVLYVNSGWRSPAYQEKLLDDAVAEYGSREEAARWVATPTTSAHVSGDAVDIGHAEATAWLSEHGAAYGMCQIYANEPWHYELRPDAVASGCPTPYADPTQDPRMHP
jgi:D-alanyl-D-alanine carboxypeptidase